MAKKNSKNKDDKYKGIERRTMIGITVTKEFVEWDLEFQRLCRDLHFNPAETIREIIISWVKRTQEAEETIKKLF